MIFVRRAGFTRVIMPRLCAVVFAFRRVLWLVFTRCRVFGLAEAGPFFFLSLWRFGVLLYRFLVVSVLVVVWSVPASGRFV